STPPLLEALKKHTARPIAVQSNLVDWGLFDAPSRRRNRQFNLLISGTPTHQGDWSIIEEPLAEFLKVHREGVKAIFFGELPTKFSGHPAVQLINFQPDYKSYASRLRELDIHAALVPLEDTEFNRCKSDIKWLEYSAAGIAGIFSNIMPYNSTIKNGETGLLVNNTADAWFHGMEHLLANPEVASAIIDSARREVREHHSIEALSGSYVALFNDLLGRKHVRNLYSELPILPARLGAQAHRFLDKHILWRFNRKH
ncbi:MAG: glycosyltransferase, partial [Candidatus Nitrotoga sp.]